MDTPYADSANALSDCTTETEVKTPIPFWIPENTPKARPFIKWLGGKNQLLPEIRKIYPAELGKRITKYAEPFIGGGAVLFDILNRYDLSEIYISDVNKELINAYRTIKEEPDLLIRCLGM